MPKSSTQKSADYRMRHREARWRIVNVRLPPEAAAGLAELRERWGMTADWLVVERALSVARGVEQAMRPARGEICIPDENSS